MDGQTAGTARARFGPEKSTSNGSGLPHRRGRRRAVALIVGACGDDDGAGSGLIPTTTSCV